MTLDLTGASPGDVVPCSSVVAPAWRPIQVSSVPSRSSSPAEFGSTVRFSGGEPAYDSGVTR